jgi:hypothetical protein
MVTGFAGVACHGIAVDTDEPLGLANAAAFGDVCQHVDGLLLGQVGMEQRSSLAFGEPDRAGSTAEEANRVVLAVMFADREVFPAPDTVIGTVGIQATEAREVIHGPPPAMYLIVSSKGCDSSLG